VVPVSDHTLIRLVLGFNFKPVECVGMALAIRGSAMPSQHYQPIPNAICSGVPVVIVELWFDTSS
jgi:hypothetical protein